MTEDVQGVAIPLTKGYVAWVDEADAEAVGKFKWRALISSGGHVYAERNERGKSILMHREILGLPCPGSKPMVDHADRDSLNNRRINLRLCPAGATHNRANTRKQTKPCTSKYKGVYFDRWHGRFSAGVRFHGFYYRVGRFDNELDAAHAYDALAIELFGAFALTNFGGEA